MLFCYSYPQVDDLRLLSGDRVAVRKLLEGLYDIKNYALTGQKLYFCNNAFALSGRGFSSALIPRALPWADSSLAFQAVSAD